MKVQQVSDITYSQYDVKVDSSSIVTVLQSSNMSKQFMHGGFDIKFSEPYEAKMFSEYFSNMISASEAGFILIDCSLSVMVMDYVEVHDVEYSGGNEDPTVSVDFRCYVQRSYVDSCSKSYESIAKSTNSAIVEIINRMRAMAGATTYTMVDTPVAGDVKRGLCWEVVKLSTPRRMFSTDAVIRIAPSPAIDTLQISFKASKPSTIESIRANILNIAKGTIMGCRVLFTENSVKIDPEGGMSQFKEVKAASDSAHDNSDKQYMLYTVQSDTAKLLCRNITEKFDSKQQFSSYAVDKLAEMSNQIISSIFVSRVKQTGI